MIKLGIICPSEIAYRRFMPAIQQVKEIKYAGVAYANEIEWFGEEEQIDALAKYEVIESEKQKAMKFADDFGGKVFHGYQNMISSGEIDAVYIPLPPALHFKWAKEALENRIHVLLEKPSATSLADTNTLIHLAQSKQLALHENYMFAFHSQLNEIQQAVEHGEVGDVRLYRIDFGFPRRAAFDFRYNRKLGGGALLDCGGYTLKYASMLLGKSAKLKCASVNYLSEFEVEIFGTATMQNDQGMTVQLAFGMDNDYRCSIDIWGSKGTITSDRILTAPSGYVPNYVVSKNNSKQTIPMSEDDAFLKSIQKFMDCIESEQVRNENYMELKRQETLVNEFMLLSGMDL